MKRAAGVIARLTRCNRCGEHHGRAAPCVPAPVTIIRRGVISETIEFGTEEAHARHKQRVDRRLDLDIARIEGQIKARGRK